MIAAILAICLRSQHLMLSAKKSIRQNATSVREYYKKVENLKARTDWQCGAGIRFAFCARVSVFSDYF